MTEAQLTLKFLKRLRARYPHAVCFKVNDRTTSGVPDADITLAGRNTKIEFKKDNYALTPLQRKTLFDLGHASHGRALVAIFKTKTKTIDIGEVRDPQEARPRILADGLTQDDAITFVVGVTDFGR